MMAMPLMFHAEVSRQGEDELQPLQVFVV